MKKETQYYIAGGAVALLALLWLLRRRSSGGNNFANLDYPEANASPFNNPNPNANNVPGFRNINNINIDGSLFATLSQKYIPLFGLVGVAGVGNTGSINVSGTLNYGGQLPGVYNFQTGVQ